ncbi:uncharacterized protein UV8b_05721 [Ustilaginoidea virens]|uniref:Uncharacterized protein n=1 Tax=Ustilaginoidea virens TaxID=1159556 RepID=A0A8E5HTY4_USTVR|nr:uncharacterized protein UV8b_05721 [Ustilaginoidea virens]QUC21478.1 hypothetical protein UV8b_05721 [Ustilaginoidea virens]
MCVWVTTEHWTYCGCTVTKSCPKPTCRCPKVLDLATQNWIGYCDSPQCPNPAPPNSSQSGHASPER